MELQARGRPEEAQLVRLEIAARVASVRAGSRELLVDELLGAVQVGFPPSFDLVVVDRHGVLVRAYGGLACSTGPVVTATRETRYDLASLTKVVATTTLALWLAEQGRWTLDDRVASWLPGFPRMDLSLFHLITHTSGLVAHRPFFLLGRDPRAIRRAVYAASGDGGEPGAVLYSDLNFMLLGWAVARCAQSPLDRLFHEIVAIPLAMNSTRFRPTERERGLTAATELDGDQRSGPGLVWGEVHDGNAHALGGVAGHAGLFAPASDLARFVGALLEPGRHPVLSASAIADMVRPQAGAQPDVRGLGWRLQPEGWGAWPHDTFWHTGFTGTSLLVAPSAGVGVVLLTNAVHPFRQLDRQAEMRVRIHSALAGWLA
jgi:CubicO group peptidase (beta-lactamase class C family)